METKKCCACKEVLHVSRFNKSVHSKDGLSSRCKTCHAEHKTEWRKRNPGKAKEVDRRSNLKRYYGITLEKYNAMLKEQDGKCACCGHDAAGRTKDGTLHVDHCHATGRIRGLLCSFCNTAIGLLGDSVEEVLKAALYLERASAKPPV